MLLPADSRHLEEVNGYLLSEPDVEYNEPGTVHDKLAEAQCPCGTSSGYVAMQRDAPLRELPKSCLVLSAAPTQARGWLWLAAVSSMLLTWRWAAIQRAGLGDRRALSTALDHVLGGRL